MSERAGKGSSGVVNNVIALFLLLGGALLSGAWALFAAEIVDPALVESYGSSLFVLVAPSPAISLASYGPVTLLALIGALALRRRDGALGALVVPLLALVTIGASRIAEALATLATGYSAENSENWFNSAAADYIPTLSALAGLIVILLVHRVRAGRLLAFSFVGWAFALAVSLRDLLIFLVGLTDEELYYSLSSSQGWAFWWLLPALGVYLYARRAAADETGRGRASVARIFGGLLLVSLMLVSGNFSSEVLPIGALGTLGVSLLLVLLAMRERATAYLWTSAVGIFSSLSVINGVYFSGAIGLSGALLVEGLLLLGVGGATFALRSRLVGQKSSS